MAESLGEGQNAGPQHPTSNIQHTTSNAQWGASKRRTKPPPRESIKQKVESRNRGGRPRKPPKATPKPVASHGVGTHKLPPSYPQATPKPPSGDYPGLASVRFSTPTIVSPFRYRTTTVGVGRHHPLFPGWLAARNSGLRGGIPLGFSRIPERHWHGRIKAWRFGLPAGKS